MWVLVCWCQGGGSWGCPRERAAPHGAAEAEAKWQHSVGSTAWRHCEYWKYCGAGQGTLPSWRQVLAPALSCPLGPRPLPQVMLYQPKPPAAEGGEQQEEEGEETEERLGRLSFVDLAGSERAQRTGNVGVRLK